MHGRGARWGNRMTTIDCPHKCGNTVDTAYCNWDDPRFLGIGVCLGCRRHIDEVQTPLPGMCWIWFGPLDHRMRCRRPAGHEPQDRPGTTWHIPVEDGHDCSYDEDEWELTK